MDNSDTRWQSIRLRKLFEKNKKQKQELLLSRFDLKMAVYEYIQKKEYGRIISEKWGKINLGHSKKGRNFNLLTIYLKHNPTRFGHDGFFQGTLK